MASQAITLDPIRFVRRFAHQLSSQCSAFGARIAHSVDAMTAIKSNDPVAALVAVFKLLASDTALAPQSSAGMRFLMVDSLDESLCVTDWKRSVASLLCSREVTSALPE